MMAKYPERELFTIFISMTMMVPTHCLVHLMLDAHSLGLKLTT
jgi:hypothetical protein